MNPLDSTLQRSFPSVMVPTREPVVPMTAAGERLLVAGNGVFLEILRPWIRLIRRISIYAVSTAIPYGVVEEVTELLCGRVPPELIRAFAEQARAACPNETGGWIVWNPRTKAFRLVPVVVLSHDCASLRYDRPQLVDGEVLAADCHSHGRFAAGFSTTDDQDDRFDVKFAVVLGRCDTRRMDVALRLCAKGIFERSHNIPASWLDAVGETNDFAAT
ncbi:PRTRC system protein A [Cupriavidus basilensis]|uniref:PRTRC system protein A n=1 Tax=Cupriavidus basilensis TaxID=68895 RepID=UPI0039F70628